MGVLTEATMRLRKEMMAWRHMRVALRNDLVRQTDERRTRVSALCGGFARDRAGAHRAWFGPTLFESQTAERQQRRGLVEAARAKAQAEEQPPATPKAEPRSHEPAKPVPAPVPAAAPAAPAPIASLAPVPRTERLLLKGSKKH
jgi:hypothetical protein